MRWRAGALVALSFGVLAALSGADRVFADAASIPSARHAGFDDMSPQVQAMQRDDAQNPGMLWVRDGEAAWSAKPASGAPACAGCHGDAAKSMRGVAARYPAFDAKASRPVTLHQRIDACRVERQQAEPSSPDSDAALAIEAYVGNQSRGLPIAPPGDPKLEPFRARGEQLFRQRIGQLDLSCAQCHDAHAGGRLGGSVIPQGHATGYPLYRLEWQGLGSLQRRLRGCMTGVRAEPFAYDALELTELELYLKQRAAGLVVETPAVRP